MIDDVVASNVTKDNHVDEELAKYLNPDNPRSFFLFAGAGSGKTRSLVKALDHIRNVHGRTLSFRGQRVGVITYTNAACDEITSRLDFSPLFYVSTIHSFAWELIQDCNYDIREWLRKGLSGDVAQLQLEEAKGRAGTKASITRLAQIESKTRRLGRLDEIKSFIYSPTEENREPNSLNHSEVIAICAGFLSRKPLMQWILVGRFPMLLIDESQDTNKHLIDAFFAVAEVHNTHFTLGLLGDVMQRIYADGKEKIEHFLPTGFATPSKKLNHRCPKRVVTLINQIRSAVDDHAQEPRTDAIDGAVRLFIRPAGASSVHQVEDAIREKMSEVAADDLWKSRDRCKILTLEHHMAAKRLGFANVLEPLLEVDTWRTSLLDGKLPLTRFFAQDVFPLVEAVRRGDEFSIARIARAKSPLMTPSMLQEVADVGEQLRKVKKAVSGLAALWEDAEPSIGTVLDKLAEDGFFDIPEILKPIVKLRASNNKASLEAEKADPLSEQAKAIISFLEAPFKQIGYYKDYVAGEASFDTHQGVKGREFDRVMVIMDDQEARGFMFGYDKLFGAKEPSPIDLRNVAEGKETGLDRTRRLLYVTCSRAEKSLALVVYTDRPLDVKSEVLANGWFTEAEVDI